jgi:hypothetical protein
VYLCLQRSSHCLIMNLTSQKFWCEACEMEITLSNYPRRFVYQKKLSCCVFYQFQENDEFVQLDRVIKTVELLR